MSMPTPRSSTKRDSSDLVCALASRPTSSTIMMADRHKRREDLRMRNPPCHPGSSPMVEPDDRQQGSSRFRQIDRDLLETTVAIKEDRRELTVLLARCAM